MTFGELAAYLDQLEATNSRNELVRILSDRGYAERLGAAARLTGEEWGVTPDAYSAKILALVRRVTA